MQKVVLVHDYLKEFGGAERVLQVLMEMYPQAKVYTAFAKKKSRVVRLLGRDRIKESKWGWLLKIGKLYSYLRFLQPWVWKSVDLRGYDLVITSCSGYIARGFKVDKQAKVVAYCHTPPKWLYGYETPTQAQHKWWGKMYLWVFGPWIRYFDYQSAQRVNKWIANSQEVKRRIAKFYGKQAEVVYPPIELVNRGEVKVKRKGYYLVVGRLVGAKGVELAKQACRRMGRELVVVGEGGRLRREVREGVRYTGWVSDKELVRLYSQARGYLALAKDEDFGMTVVEAISQGTPVVALASGGYKETVIKQNGVLVEEMGADGVVKGMRKLEKMEWDREAMRRWAMGFGKERFVEGVRRIVDSVALSSLEL